MRYAMRKLIAVVAIASTLILIGGAGASASATTAAEGASISIDVTQGPPGTAVTVTGSGFTPPPAGRVKMYFRPNGGPFFFLLNHRVHMHPDGSFVVVITIPDVPPGWGRIVADNKVGGVVTMKATASFHVRH
jgi:hypothetical protein